MNHLKTSLLEEIKEKLDNGEAIRALAREYGVDRKVVHRLKTGQIKLLQRRNMDNWREIREQTMMFYNRPYSRCRECGNPVQKPCLLCALNRRDYKVLQPILLLEEE